MKKRVLAILFCLVLAVGLLPTAAFAAEDYGLYVNGEQFTSEKLSIACGEGTAAYDPSTRTLTLTNAVITNGGTSNENPKYGIRVIGGLIEDTDLTIKLSGTNSITLDNGGGIFANYGDGRDNDGSGSVNYNIIGSGKLTINVRWDALYTLNGNISISGGAELDIRSDEGCGIMSYNRGDITIDSAKVSVDALYSAANAKELVVKNRSEVVLTARGVEFNAAYMGNGNGAGKIEIIDSRLEATSYYPALYTDGSLTINGGEVKCTSTADSAIWTQGDILVKGGAKVTTDGKSAMGGYVTFTVEAAEIDAKNTNENDIPAIFDECVPVIADGYQLTYAKAVDADNKEIDLLSSGTQYFALYKNVHFITKAKSASTGGYYYAGPTVTAVLNGPDAKSATDYSGGIYGLIFRSTAGFSGFRGVQVDGKTIAAANYTVEDNGGIEVYLKAVYLQTLAAGKHTLTILSSAGDVTTEFTVNGGNNSPKTFDAGVGIYAVSALLSLTGMAWVGKKKF